MSGSEVYETVGPARFITPGGRGRLHVRPTSASPATTCGRPIGPRWRELPPGLVRSDVCGWCVTTASSDERSGFQQVLRPARGEVVHVR